MKIAIVGAHGVGKTTLAKIIAEDLSLKLIPDTAAEAFHKGFVVNEATPPENQLWMLTRQIEYEREFLPHFIADKALYDNIVYSRNIFKNVSLLQVIEEIVLRNASYDLLLYIPIEIPLENDGRSVDPVFQKKIDSEYKALLHNLKLPYIKIAGTLSQRVLKAKNVIGEISRIIKSNIYKR